MNIAPSSYPESSRKRDHWILDRRGKRKAISPFEAVGWFNEVEPDAFRKPKAITTLFLANRECPFRCVMCDLWQSTLTETVPEGAIVQQIEKVLKQTPRTDWIKLYNSGSFFDPQAIPPSDYRGIAELVSPFERVIVESHPLFLKNLSPFREMLSSDFEIAVGLETSHQETLSKLNKRMNLDQFRRAAELLAAREIALRVFLLLRPPFISAEESKEAIESSIDFAFESGAGVVSIIPTREGNGAMEALAQEELCSRPSMRELEEAHAYGLRNGGGLVFADLWDLERLARCPVCFEARRQRLIRMNLEQILLPAITCDSCDGRL